MPVDKTTSLREAVSRIQPGSSIAMGLALEHAIPSAAGHELIRSVTDDLTLIGPISDILFDQLIGAGIVDHVRAAWVGNVSAGTGYCYRRAVENDRLTVEDHSNFSVALALEAGSMGVPYLPTRSLFGSDILANGPFEVTTDPFEDERVVLVPAIEPDWTIVHVQRASPAGDAHFWGNSGVTESAVGAADNVLVTAEEVVDPEVIKSDPSRTTITRENVAAVVECPYGAHPSSMAGYYDRDNQYYLDYHAWTETEADYADWVEEWVHGVDDRSEYMDKIDRDLEPNDVVTAAEVRYGQ